MHLLSTDSLYSNCAAKLGLESLLMLFCEKHVNVRLSSLLLVAMGGLVVYARSHPYTSATISNEALTLRVQLLWALYIGSSLPFPPQVAQSKTMALLPDERIGNAGLWRMQASAVVHVHSIRGCCEQAGCAAPQWNLHLLYQVLVTHLLVDMREELYL